jgi:CubicO group peptidase (beta-lactamase class C family)
MKLVPAAWLVLAAWWLALAAGMPSVAAQSRGAIAPRPEPSEPVPPVLAAAAAEADQLPRLRSLLVSQRGTLILERYYRGAGPNRTANVKSVSKSVVSALVGLAIERGLVPSVREPIGTYFGDMLRATADAPKRAITVEDLLTMRSGLETTSNRNYGAWVTSGNWVRWALNRPLVSSPGTEMDYSTGSTHLLSAIVTKAAKTSTWQFAQKHLATPLGFTLAQWTRDPQGIYFGGNEMALTPRQMLAFGELYVRQGRVGDRQVLPAAWVRDTFVPRGRSRRGDQDGREYGYGWWMRDMAGQRVYYAWGYGGQFIFVAPMLDLVVVATSTTDTNDERRAHRRTLMELVESLVIAPLAMARLDAGRWPSAGPRAHRRGRAERSDRRVPHGLGVRCKRRNVEGLGYADGDDRSHAGGAFDFDHAADQRREPVRDRQTKAGAAVGAGDAGVGLYERLEATNAVELGRGHADA